MSAKPKRQSNSMAPPPVPTTQTPILEAELREMNQSLMQVAVKTGQVYAFYIDSKRLGMQTNAVNPPQSLVNGLGREVERYDQLCDSIQFTLKRSIAILRRDLRRREQQLKEKELAATSTPAPHPLQPELKEGNDIAASTAALPSDIFPNLATSSSLLGRRPSAISMTSLNRPALPMKLDLSSAALHSANEATGIFPSGLASPVTLAPKSARPLEANEIPDDFMAAFSNNAHEVPVDIDLTLPESGPIPSHTSSLKGLGSSADEPIELDMEMDVPNMVDLFGDAVSEGGMEGIFTPVEGNQAHGKNSSDRDKNDLDLQILAGLSESSATEPANLFASLSDEKQAGTSFSEDLPTTDEPQFDFSSMEIPDFDFSSGNGDLYTPLYGSLENNTSNGDAQS